MHVLFETCLKMKKKEVSLEGGKDNDKEIKMSKGEDDKHMQSQSSICLPQIK